MNDNESGIKKNTQKSTGCGILFPLLLGFFLVLVALPVTAWKSGQRKWHKLHK